MSARLPVLKRSTDLIYIKEKLASKLNTKLLPVRVFYVSGQDDGINFIERGAINEHHMVSEEYVIQKLTINKLNQSKLY